MSRTHLRSHSESASTASSQPSTIPRRLAGVRRGIHAALRVVGWPARTILIGLIRAYQLTLSGLFGGQCRFDPSCSAYAAATIRNRGALVGSGLAAWRILRCNPFGRGGADPAPRAATYEPVIQEPAA